MPKVLQETKTDGSQCRYAPLRDGVASIGLVKMGPYQLI